MSTPRKSTSHMAPSTPRRPCTPENAQGRSPRAPGPPSSPDRRISTSDRPSKSYLRPTVSSTMHHGNSNTYQPRKSIDKPPFLPPSSVGVHSQHHKNPSSSGKSSLSLKGILTRATNAMKSGSDKYRKTSTGAGINIGKGSGANTPVRPRSPATLPKRKDLARSNSVPKKLSAGKKTKERDTMSICSIEDTLPEHLPDPVEIASHAPQTVIIQSTVPDVEPQEEPSYAEKTEDNFVRVEDTEVNLIEQLESSKESPKEVHDDIVTEEYQEEQPKMDADATEAPVDTNNVVIGENQEEEAHDIEPVNVVDEVSQETDNVVTVSAQEEEEKPEEAVTELPKEPEEIVAANAGEESKADEEVIAENTEAPKEEVEEEKPTVENETKVEETTPIAEENVASVETPKEAQNGTVKETIIVEEKAAPAETEVKIEEVVVETPKVEENLATATVSEPKRDKAAVRKPDAVATRREGAISNDVIEETKSKLMEKRKNKVLALVGAFETVMQKPEEGSTRR